MLLRSAPPTSSFLANNPWVLNKSCFSDWCLTVCSPFALCLSRISSHSISFKTLSFTGSNPTFSSALWTLSLLGGCFLVYVGLYSGLRGLQLLFRLLIVLDMSWVGSYDLMSWMCSCSSSVNIVVVSFYWRGLLYLLKLVSRAWSNFIRGRSLLVGDLGLEHFCSLLGDSYFLSSMLPSFMSMILRMPILGLTLACCDSQRSLRLES